jgi:S1-C subfamily serine protease
LLDGTQAHGAILGRDPAVDVAILQIAGGKLQAGIPEESSQLRAGALAVVVGRTLDAGLSASAGILGAAGGPRRTWRGGSLTQFLRLDVNLYPSQAGAAVVGATGRLIGMATGAMSRHSALAIPFETLNRVADELLKSGHIRQGYLGVSLQPVPIPAHLRSRASLASETGLMILSVEPDTGAEKAGLQLGDIVIAAGGESIGDTESLQALLRGDAVGAPIKLTLFHAGEVIEREVRVSDRGPGRRH